MAISSVANLVELICGCQLLEPAQGDELAHKLAAHSSDPRLLAKELVRRGWVTSYQLSRLAQGRGQELRLGPYVLLELLGKGGMGQVFKARRQGSDHVLALKVLRQEYVSHPLALKRFYREAHAIAQLAHPNVVRAHEAGQAGNIPFLAMEYVPGADLDRLVKQSGPLPIACACDYVRQAALGLQHAHERGIVHRDVKPRNLLVTPTRPGVPGVVKVVDFGLARLESEMAGNNRLTRLGKTVGTAEYMAPEQAADGRAADVRADVYSLGCSLFYLLTGRPPFAEENNLESLPARLPGEPPPVACFRPGVTPELSKVLARMLAGKPDHRYQTAAAAAAALEPFCTEAVTGGMASPSTPGRTAAPAIQELPGAAGRRRRRRLLALAGAAAVLLIGVGTFLALRSSPFTEPRNEERPARGGDPPREGGVTPPRTPGSTRGKVKKKEEEDTDTKEDGKRKPGRKKEEVEDDEPATPPGRP